MNDRSGKYISNLYGKLEYKSFKPSSLPPKPGIIYDTYLVELISEANRQIGVLNGISKKIPNIDLFIALYVRKEALLSSQIEGTQATLDDILNPYLDDNKNQDIGDVINYIYAAKYGKEMMEELPISSILLKEIHQKLMKNIRGSEKKPGEFRNTQNWIGHGGSTLQTATFVPPNIEDMTDALAELDIFINTDDNLDPLVKAALIHYQFETIHPFLDGNGRIGRLLILLFLMNNKILNSEVLYISYFLKNNQVEYYDRLMEVRQKGNYEQWLKFFLLAIRESSTDAIETIERMQLLHDMNSDYIKVLGRKSKTVMTVFNYVESNPIIDIGKTSKELNLSYNAVAGAVSELVNLGILVQEKTNKRNRVFSYEDLLDILRKDTL